MIGMTENPPKAWRRFSQRKFQHMLPEQIEDTDQKYPFISVVYPQNNFRRPHHQIDLCRFQQPMSALFKHSKQEHTQKKGEKYILLVKIQQIAVKGKIVRHL